MSLREMQAAFLAQLQLEVTFSSIANGAVILTLSLKGFNYMRHGHFGWKIGR